MVVLNLFLFFPLVSCCFFSRFIHCVYLWFSYSHEHIEILTVNGELLFFRQREGPFYPTLRLLHKCKILLLQTHTFYCNLHLNTQWHFLLFPAVPFILPHQQVDKGAIKFVLSGANIMCPGLTSPGAKLNPAGVDTVVVSFMSWPWSNDDHFSVLVLWMDQHKTELDKH